LTKGPHSHIDRASHFGYPRGYIKPRTSEFRRKNTGTMGSNALPDLKSKI